MVPVEVSGSRVRLTVKHYRVLAATVRLTVKEGIVPSRRRLAEELGVTTATVQAHIESLRRLGYEHPSRRETV